jgi:hypothetical protein
MCVGFCVDDLNSFRLYMELVIEFLCWVVSAEIHCISLSYTGGLITMQICNYHLSLVWAPWKLQVSRWWCRTCEFFLSTRICCHWRHEFIPTIKKILKFWVRDFLAELLSRFFACFRFLLELFNLCIIIYSVVFWWFGKYKCTMPRTRADWWYVFDSGSQVLGTRVN